MKNINEMYKLAKEAYAEASKAIAAQINETINN